MKLKSMVVADPRVSVAELTADQCERLAERRDVTTTLVGTFERVEELSPELLVMSLELAGLDAAKAMKRLLKAVPRLFVIATYRELSLPRMATLRNLGFEELVAQPVDVMQIYRAASRRFSTPFRRHDRFAINLEVIRADGVLIGNSIDLSEGGMCMSALHPMTVDESVLVDLSLPGTNKPLRIRCQVLHVEGQPPAPVVARMLFIKLWGPEHRRLLNFLGTQTPITEAGPA